MDDRRFDTIIRAFGTGSTRRVVLGGVVAGVGGWLAPFAGRSARAQAEVGNVCLQTDPDGTVVAAHADGTPGTQMNVTRGCAGQSCTATKAFVEDGATAPFLVAETKAEVKSPQEQVLSISFVGDGVDYQVTVNSRTFEIETTTNGGPPVHGTYDPSTREIKGIAKGLTLPDDVAAKLMPIRPALAAIIGEAVLGCTGPSCLPDQGERPPPTPVRGGEATAGEICRGGCDAAAIAGAIVCCVGTEFIACAGCVAEAWEFNGFCRAGCTLLYGAMTAGPGQVSVEVAESGDLEESEPTSTPALTPTATPTPTPVAPLDCSDDDLECGGQCIPASECPADSCCLDAATCDCTCPVCTEFEAFDDNTCACECTLTGCPPNYAYDETACTCTCQPTDCPQNMTFSDTSCACICQPTDCPPNFQFDAATCACLCVPPACPANFQVDAASCSCICAPPACPANYLLDEANCSCVCAEVGCAEGEVFDPASCLCVSSGGTGSGGTSEGGA